jgi:hypothetical protein
LLCCISCTSIRRCMDNYRHLLGKRYMAEGGSIPALQSRGYKNSNDKRYLVGPLLTLL